MQLADAEAGILKSQDSPRKNHGFCKLQTAVNRYLDDSGYWIDHVSDVLRQLRRVTEECDEREQAIAERERAVRQREEAVDRLLLQINSRSVNAAQAQQAVERATLSEETAAIANTLTPLKSDAASASPGELGRSPARSRFDAERKRRRGQR